MGTGAEDALSGQDEVHDSGHATPPDQPVFGRQKVNTQDKSGSNENSEQEAKSRSRRLPDNTRTVGQDEPVKDHTLVAQCKKGDQNAFRILVERYQQRIHMLALGMVHNPQDAQDITQEAFVKVHRYLGNFQGSASFYTWLYRITYNLCIDHLRKGGKLQTVDYDDRIRREPANDPGGLVPSRTEGNPARSARRKELAQKINEAIETLPPYHRAVILMRERDGMSYKEMAKVMKVSKGTIMSRLHHARKKLQKALAPYLEGELDVE